jgi:hypothetical protein
VIILILDDAGHDQFPSRSACRRDRFGCALVRVNAAKEKQILAAMRIEGKVLQRDTVMDRCRIAQVWIAIGLADRDIVGPAVVYLEGGQNALRREPVATNREKVSGRKSAWL